MNASSITHERPIWIKLFFFYSEQHRRKHKSAASHTIHNFHFSPIFFFLVRFAYKIFSFDSYFLPVASVYELSHSYAFEILRQMLCHTFRFELGKRVLLFSPTYLTPVRYNTTYSESFLSYISLRFQIDERRKKKSVKKNYSLSKCGSSVVRTTAKRTHIIH